MRQLTDFEIAFHEAGHAFIAFSSEALRLNAGGCISINDTGAEFGGVDVEPDPMSNVPDHRYVFELGVVAGAGWAAQQRHWEENSQPIDEPLLRLCAADDLKRLREMLGSGVFL